MSDVDRLAPEPVERKLSTGSVVRIERLRTRQFFKLMRIITSGAGHMLMEYRLDGDLNDKEFTGRLLGLVLLALPEAEQESIEFLQSMCVPVGLIEGRNLSAADKERNTELLTNYRAAMDNPELEDTLEIIETIVRVEAPDLQKLGKRLKAMMKIAEKTGQLTENTKSSTQKASLEDSPEPTISSPPNTDGTTSESATSTSAA